MKYQIIQGDNRETLKQIADNSIDAIVTDPPYGIEFLGKTWDVNTGELETYQECLRVLKPGGHILAFSAARTYHHLAMTLERAGFEIRDQIMWIYSSGFPKSQDIGKSIERSQGKRKKLKNVNSSNIVGIGTQCPQCGKYENGSNQKKCQSDPCPLKEVLKPADNEWAGWGTALKPAHEPIALARKPVKGSIKDNVQEWGTGGLNIDACRVKADDLQEIAAWHARYQYTSGSKATFNNILSESQDKQRQKHSGEFDSTKAQEDILKGRFPSNVLGEIPDYQKYFYCPKVSRKERHMGFDNANSTKSMLDDMGASYIDDKGNPVPYEGRHNRLQIYIPGVGAIYTHGLKDEYAKWCVKNNKTNLDGNNHPTVKPVALMEYLIKLITPPGGTVLDPFNGSGSTGMAAAGLGFDYIGLELDPNYVEITQKRIEAWLTKDEPEEDNNFKELFEEDAAE